MSELKKNFEKHAIFQMHVLTFGAWPRVTVTAVVYRLGGATTWTKKIRGHSYHFWVKYKNILQKSKYLRKLALQMEKNNSGSHEVTRHVNSYLYMANIHLQMGSREK